MPVLGKVAVKFTTRPDGLGNPKEGFYVIANGIAIGCPRKTYDEAHADMRLYIAELRSMAKV